MSNFLFSASLPSPACAVQIDLIDGLDGNSVSAVQPYHTNIAEDNSEINKADYQKCFFRVNVRIFFLRKITYIFNFSKHI